MKKGQITIFLIIGLLLVGGAGIYFYANSNEQAEKIDVTEKKIFSNPIENYMQGCIEETAKGAIIMTGLEGGMASEDDEYILFFGEKTPYYYGTENSKIPSLSEVEAHLENKIAAGAKECLNKSSFPDYRITAGEPVIDAIIGERRINFELKYPLSIFRDGASEQISSFSTGVNSRLKAMHNVSMQYVEMQKKNPAMICASCLIQLASKNDLKINTYSLGKTVGFEILDNSSSRAGGEYRFAFAIEYPEAAQ